MGKGESLMAKHIGSRDEVRAAILSSELMDRKEFTSADAAKATGYSTSSMSYHLLQMVNLGMLSKRKKPQGSKTFIMYSKKPRNWLTEKWR